MAMAVGLWMMGNFAAANSAPDAVLERNCLACHEEQKLPDNLIYRRYLIRYSSQENIQKAMTNYLEHPDKNSSIMPAEFFLRFPMKEASGLNRTEMDDSIRRYMDFFDVRKRLRLKKTNRSLLH
jgi:hypothetical protein